MISWAWEKAKPIEDAALLKRNYQVIATYRDEAKIPPFNNFLEPSCFDQKFSIASRHLLRSNDVSLIFFGDFISM